MNDQSLAAISSQLDTLGARLARRQTEPDADITILDAYAALLTARFELAPHVTVLPTPILDDDAAQPSAVADDLAAAWTALREYALDSDQDDALACARAATYVDDARRHLLGAS
jgi:hypothetical protein